MHAFPWWFDFLMNALFVLLSWQTWVVIGGVAVGIFCGVGRTRRLLTTKI